MTTRPAHDVVEVERRIAARPDTVFAYFTDAERYRRWQGVDAELDHRPGGVFRVTMTGRSRTVARGVFVEVEAPTRLVFTWGWEAADGSHDNLPDGMSGVPPGSSTVEVVLVPDGDDATLLRLRHTGLPTSETATFHTGGWDLTLDRLAAVAAGADPGPDPMADL